MQQDCIRKDCGCAHDLGETADPGALMPSAERPDEGEPRVPVQLPPDHVRPQLPGPEDQEKRQAERVGNPLMLFACARFDCGHESGLRTRPFVPGTDWRIVGDMLNEQKNESSARQDVRSDAASESRNRESKQPHWLLKIISAVLAPLGISWAKKVQEEVARLEREAEEAALQAGRKTGDEISGRGPKQT
jgi:hypothetical protein